MTFALSLIHQENLSLTKTMDKIISMGQDDVLNIQSHQLHEWEDIFSQALTKISTLSQLENLLPANRCNPVLAMIDIISTYQSPIIYSDMASPAEKLSLDFFFSHQPIDYFSRQFLFGTPSQRRHPGG
ncbi:MAG: hypothetical protein C0392_16600 [Syntrophus sp. (in: bacteria)]|nr:hypothetical protein [Syntrophus sp. (in: bacteria)]